MNITIVFSINNDYAPYLYICLKSLLAHIKPCDKYKAYILYTELSAEHQENLLKLQQDNLKIEFINVEGIIGRYKENFSLNNHFTIETYYRFFLPDIFPEFDKVLYLDADTLIMRDIAPLFSIDIGSNYLGVTHDCEIVRMSDLAGTVYSDYFRKTLGVKIENYFQAGVMIVNLAKMRQNNITDKLLSALKKIGTPKFVDQDILNMVCQNNVLFIPQNWDYTWHLQFMGDDYLQHIGGKLALEYQAAKENPYIIHFTGNNMKPINYPKTAESKMFLELAKDSPYYAEFNNRIQCECKKYKLKIKRLKRKILKYKILNIFTFGFNAKKYSDKIQKKIFDIQKIVRYQEKN